MQAHLNIYAAALSYMASERKYMFTYESTLSVDQSLDFSCHPGGLLCRDGDE